MKIYRYINQIVLLRLQVYLCSKTFCLDFKVPSLFSLSEIPIQVFVNILLLGLTEITPSVFKAVLGAFSYER